MGFLFIFIFRPEYCRSGVSRISARGGGGLHSGPIGKVCVCVGGGGGGGWGCSPRQVRNKMCVCVGGGGGGGTSGPIRKRGRGGGGGGAQAPGAPSLDTPLVDTEGIGPHVVVRASRDVHVRVFSDVVLMPKAGSFEFIADQAIYGLSWAYVHPMPYTELTITGRHNGVQGA